MTIKLQISVSEEHYHYLCQRAETEGATLDGLLSDIIAADAAWRQTLMTDPRYALVGQIADDFDTSNIDTMLYK